jgi:hypothetical protein
MLVCESSYNVSLLVASNYTFDIVVVFRVIRLLMPKSVRRFTMKILSIFYYLYRISLYKFILIVLQTILGGVSKLIQMWEGDRF